MAELPLARVTVRAEVREPDAWFWQVPAVAQIREHGMALAPVTVFVGENGSGKSTVVEAIARAWQELLTAQVHHWGPAPSAEDADLWRDLWLETAYPRPQGGIWLRAESMHELFASVDRQAFELRAFDGVPLNTRSHGEGFLAFLESFPGATAYELDGAGFAARDWADLDLVRDWEAFFDDPARLHHHLLDD